MLKKLFCLACISALCFIFQPVSAQNKTVETGKTEAQSSLTDVSSAVLVMVKEISGPEGKARDMLLDEVEKRSRVRWPVDSQLPKTGNTGIVLGKRSDLVREFPVLADLLKNSFSDKAEGYQIITTETGLIIVAGNDERGVLFGAGKLLRLMYYSKGKVTVARQLNISSSPQYALRGHQLGYRPKTNSYDGWSVPMWEQYIRDLVVFGTNAIELIPPVSDDDPDSPHFPMEPMKMMIEMSRLAKEYGIECWVWYPAMERDYSDKATETKAIREWGEVLAKLPRVDAIFVPGGDPGHTAPKVLFSMLEKQTAQLKKLHPGAKMWMSPQGFNGAWMEDFYSLMKAEPDWLEGIVFGPQHCVSLEELRASVPKKYKMRFYPDITHSQWAQYPVPDWDFAYMATLNREPINPRPLDQSLIFKRLQPIADYGFLTYSEGCNDDVNKMIWSSLGWDPRENITDILRDYSRYFIGSQVGEQFAQGLLSLERNWRGALAVNNGVNTTLDQFREMEKSATPVMLQNWRFQQALYRAYYDATVRSRLLLETAQEEKAIEYLREAPALGSMAALTKAGMALAKPGVPYAAETRARVFELAEALFQSIHMQLSVPRYQAIAVRRGANLDLIDFPLSNAPWLLKQFSEIALMPNEQDRLHRIDEVLNRTNPGAGGFYDDLGKPGSQPHLVMGTSYSEDPASLKSPMSSMVVRRDHSSPVSSCTYAETLHDFPLEMYYPDLDKNARYRLRVVFGPEGRTDLRLIANDTIEFHPFRPKDMNYVPQEFDIPAEATKKGNLRLKWNRPAGLGGSGRGTQVAEVWLMRVNDTPVQTRTPYQY
jgi:hypothetical protein